MTRRCFLYLYILFAILFSFFEITRQYTAANITLLIMMLDIVGAFALALVSERFCYYFFSRFTNWDYKL